MRESVMFLLLVLVAGCGIEPHNTIGPDNPVHNGSKENIKKPAVVDDSMGAKSEVFCKVQNIFDNNCIKCHSANGQSPSLVRGSAPSVLINQKGHHGHQIVKPGSSSDSELFKSLSWDGKTPSPLGEHFSIPLAWTTEKALIQPMISSTT